MQQFDYYLYQHTNGTSYVVATENHTKWRCLTGRVHSKDINKSFKLWSEGQGDSFTFIDTFYPSIQSHLIVNIIKDYSENEKEKKMAVCKARGNRLDVETKENIISLLDKGVKVSYICERFQVSRPTVYKLQKAA